MKVAPLISVCIPVYETEPYLEACLRSVLLQDFDNFEVVVVSDDSRGRDGRGRSAKKIVRSVEKECRRLRKAWGLAAVELHFIEHHENRGLVEVRRTLVYETQGKYILQCDSDDQLEEGALKALAAMALDGAGFDIIHGTSRAGSFDSENNFVPAEDNRYGAIYYGQIEGHAIFARWLMNKEYTANTWGKLIKRELFLQAFDCIPYTECNMAEDFLIFFFISQFAKSYIGIKEKVCRYRLNSGMTGIRKIDSMRRWHMICSTASVFTVVSEWIKEHPDSFTNAEIDEVRRQSTIYLKNNLKQLREAVVPELQPLARRELGEYWGESFVARIESLQ